MTTVAWDGRSLAADTQMTSDFKTHGHSKFYRFSDGSIGAFAGTWSRVQEAQRFIDGQADACPSEDWSALVVRPGGRVEFLDCDGCRLDVTSSPYAIGSGAHFALGALQCGKTAEEAVRVAEVFDQFTGGPVEVVRASEVVAVKPARKTTRKR
jgi:20S proteasome alpha/beta subunit